MIIPQDKPTGQANGEEMCLNYLAGILKFRIVYIELRIEKRQELENQRLKSIVKNRVRPYYSLLIILIVPCAVVVKARFIIEPSAGEHVGIGGEVGV